MSIKEKIDQDLKEAMKQKDEHRKTALRMLKTAIRRAEVEKMRELTDEEVIAVIASEAKKHRQSIEEFAKGGREDLVEQEKRELAILESYLPKPLTESEIEEAARQAIEEVGATDPRQVGQVMRVLMPRVRGRADGRLVNKIVREILAGER
ncbi:MAG TPA: GatB/YqeY domain-containing protein [Chloroflexi bacterium]|nr:GatB/YqeY domain-containing protein [Chloroflexota bacterium]